MKNKELLKKYLFKNLIVIILFALLFLFLNFIEYRIYQFHFNEKIVSLIELVQEKYPEVTKEEMIEILNAKESYQNVLKEYGYDIEVDSLIDINDQRRQMISMIKNLSFLLLFGILFWLFLHYLKRNDKEIHKIVKCVENINHQIYDLDLDESSEDQFSILKNEIYKTTIMLKEQAENSLKDKLALKNSLEDISHQLKTPLTSIRIMLENIMDDPDMDLATREYFLQQIKREIMNIDFLVQSILKLSKLEANTIQFIRQKVSVQKILEEVVQNVSNLCDLKNVNIIVKNECKKEINCDIRWQVEALTNILKNAVEYSKPGDKVMIECEDNNLYVQIKIIDFGKGMNHQDTLNIFKRFYKGKGAKEDSVGIGLALAKTMIENDNGRITVESKEGKGTTFKIKYFFE